MIHKNKNIHSHFHHALRLVSGTLHIDPLFLHPRFLQPSTKHLTTALQSFLLWRQTQQPSKFPHRCLEKNSRIFHLPSPLIHSSTHDSNIVLLLLHQRHQKRLPRKIHVETFSFIEELRDIKKKTFKSCESYDVGK